MHNHRHRSVQSRESVVTSSSNRNTPAITGVSVFSHRKKSKTIRDLPTELLLIIFDLVYNDLYGNFLVPWTRNQPREERDQSQLEWNRNRSRPDRDQWVASCSMFPYAIISICSTWRNIMLSVPKFWERLVILIDSPATPLSAITSHLWWSRERPLDVTITRRWNTEDPIDGQHERSQIIAIMRALRSHLHLIHDLRIDVTFSSSLPMFPFHFRGSATLLEHLELRCREDDGGHDCNPRAELSITRHEEFKCPKLRSLVVDGRNYREANRMDMGWVDKFSSIEELTIAHFDPRPGETFSSYDLLLPLADTIVHTLRLTDVRLNPSTAGFEIGPIHLEFLAFEDMHDSRIINQFIEWIDPLEVTFTRCTFAHVADPSRRFGYPETGGALILEEIDEDIAPLVRAFDGRDLVVVRCPSLDDTVLGMITGPRCAKYLRSLTIVDCANFSIAALRRLVESRLHLPCHPGHGDGHGANPTSHETRIQILSLTGNVPSMSETQGAWFEGHINIFDYDQESR